MECAYCGRAIGADDAYIVARSYEHVHADLHGSGSGAWPVPAGARGVGRCRPRLRGDSDAAAGRQRGAREPSLQAREPRLKK